MRNWETAGGRCAAAGSETGRAVAVGRTAGSVSVSLGSSMPVGMATNLKWWPLGDGLGLSAGEGEADTKPLMAARVRLR